jgi:hypothetical protein
MKPILGIALLLLILAGTGLGALRLLDHRDDRAEWNRLAGLQPTLPALFSPGMVAQLPDPARRFFAYVIRPGTPLLPVAAIDMGGKFSLGDRDAPAFQTMQAQQILAAPQGFVWSMRTLSGLPLSGSDTGSWTRFRIFGVIPVARLGGDPDHRRAAFGRYVAEAVFWTPAALLPGPGVNWTAIDDRTARVTVRHDGLEQAVDVILGSDGRPVEVRFQRWSDANPDSRYRLQPFGGYLSDFREVQGYRLPFRVEAGNMFDTDDYFPFFLAEVTAIRFPGWPP